MNLLAILVLMGATTPQEVVLHFSPVIVQDVKFLGWTGGRLCIADTFPSGTPREAGYRVALKTPAKLLILNDLSDLEGHVRIQSEQEALAYVRLRTDRTLHRLWGDEDVLDLQELWTNTASETCSHEHKLCGQNSRLVAPAVHRYPNGFVIVRWLNREEVIDGTLGRTRRIITLTLETVSQAGKYTRSDLLSLDVTNIPSIPDHGDRIYF